MRLCHVFVCVGLLCTVTELSPAHAQATRLPVAPGIEAGVGLSRMRWEENFTRTSRLPEVTVAFVAPTTFWTHVVFEPYAGLHFDGVHYESRYGYVDRYTVTSLRMGLLFLTLDDRHPEGGPLMVGIGAEARRPLLIRGRIYSRTDGDHRVWVDAPDPPDVDRWGLYWIVRLGLKYGQWAYLLDVTFDNDQSSLFFQAFPDNPLEYINLRLGLRILL